MEKTCWDLGANSSQAGVDGYFAILPPYLYSTYPRDENLSPLRDRRSNKSEGIAWRLFQADVRRRNTFYQIFSTDTLMMGNAFRENSYFI